MMNVNDSLRPRGKREAESACGALTGEARLQSSVKEQAVY